VGAYLFEEEQFAGNRESSADPLNSCLNQVLERRTGLPITLSVVYIELARRSGLAAESVSFPGPFLGLSIGDVYPYTAEVLMRSELCRFGRANLRRMLERFPKLERQLLGLASNELVQAQEHLMVLGRKTAKERIATVLLRLVERIGKKEGLSCALDLPMTRTDLADYTGLTTETVSRTLSQMKKEGLIETIGIRGLNIPRVVAFAAYSGDI